MNSVLRATPNQLAINNESYGALIKEVFIDPIQSVTVIDDEYPTLAGFLEDQLNLVRTDEEKKTGLKADQIKRENIERLQSVMKMCHETHNWSLDVYDGQSPRFGEGQQDYATHINHSDLLILDYHLDGGFDDGDRARNIINCLASNNNFNLVVVHTKGNAGSIEQVYNDILGDLFFIGKHVFNAEKNDINAIDAWLEVNDPDAEEFTLINAKLDIKKVIEMFSDKLLGLDISNPNHPYFRAKTEIEAIASGVDLEPSVVTSRLVLNELSNYKQLNGAVRGSKVDWFFDGDCNYIATGKVFITIVLKKNEESADYLYEKLNAALIRQKAPPMYLLMAKMRHELDEKGLEQASVIINNNFAQAGWLYDLVANAETDNAKHHDAIERHWEQLSYASKESLVSFSERMVSSLKEGGQDIKNIVQSFYPNCVQDEFEVLKHLNAYAATRSVTHNYLVTGTVFEVEAEGSYEYWVCLTPACDLVPGQSQKKWEGRIGDNHTPFQAVKLVSGNEKPKKIRSEISNNEWLFIEINGEIENLKFRADKTSSPIWETFYAVNHGVLDSQKCFFIQQLRMIPGGVRHRGKGKRKRASETKGELRLQLTTSLKVKAIVELRYEYALNLLQKFGSNQTRVGLDFVSKLWG
jgi:hypothetical protein